MGRKILFCTGEGLGNVVQTIPVVRTLTEVLNYKVDYWHAFGSFQVPRIMPYVDNWYKGLEIKGAKFNDYHGKVSTFWTRQHHNIIPGKLLNTIQPLRMDRSEVDTYMDIARDLGAEESDLRWHGECIFNVRREKFDVILNNGYNSVGSANWRIKSYPYYVELAELLKEKGYSVASIGTKSEYIKGTVDMTGHTLFDSLGLIKNSSLLVCNDSGLYHCANALDVKNVAIFTATSIDKNYDERFHVHTELVYRGDLKCRPCQATRRWNKDCKTWECRNIDPKEIIRRFLNE
jgi:ADP-heptose:LPS heptosyltransferase